MTPLGWLTMTVSVTGVIAALAWSLVRILTLPPAEAETLHGPPAIDTRDSD